MMGARVSQWMVDNIHNNINIHTYIYICISYISIARNVHEIELAVPEQPEPLNLMGTFMKLPDSGSRRSLG